MEPLRERKKEQTRARILEVAERLLGERGLEAATMEEIALDNGGVMLVTSSDEEMVKKMHSWVEKNHAEMAKMMKEMDAK